MHAQQLATCLPVAEQSLLLRFISEEWQCKLLVKRLYCGPCLTERVLHLSLGLCITIFPEYVLQDDAALARAIKVTVSPGPWSLLLANVLIL